MIRLLLAFVGALLAATAVAQAAPKVAIFPFELIDVSIEGAIAGPRADEAHRLVLVTEELRQLASRNCAYEGSTLADSHPRLRGPHRFKCNGCIDIAPAWRRGRHDGTVRNVPSSILTFHIYVRDVGSGKLIKVH